MIDKKVAPERKENKKNSQSLSANEELVVIWKLSHKQFAKLAGGKEKKISYLHKIGKSSNKLYQTAYPSNYKQVKFYNIRKSKREREK